MKYRLTVITIVIVLLGLVSAFSYAQNLPAPTDTPAASSVIQQDIFVRGGPGRDYLPVGKLLAGDHVRPLSRNAQGDWILIVYGKSYGWIRRDLAFWVENLDALPVMDVANLTPSPVLPTTPTNTPLLLPTETPAGNWVRLNEDAQSGFVRAGPGRTYLRLGQLLNGEAVDPVSRNADATWIMIRYGDGFGWIAQNLVQWVDDINQLPVIALTNLTPTATDTATNTPTVTATATSTATATPTSTATLTLTASYTPTNTSTATFTPSATLTPTALPSATNTLTSTSTLTATGTPSATSTFTPEPTTTPTALPSATNTLTSTSTLTATETPSATSTFTLEPTSTPTALPSATNTPLPTDTLTLTVTSSPTTVPSVTPTNTATLLPSASPSFTPTATAVSEVVIVPTSTELVEPSFTLTVVPSVTPVPPTNTLAPSATTTQPATATDTPMSPTPTVVLLPSVTKGSIVPYVTIRPSLTASSMVAGTHTAVGASGINLGTSTPGGSANGGTPGNGLAPEVWIAGLVLLAILAYAVFYWRGISGSERYASGFVVDTCPVCHHGHLVVEARQERMLGIPRARHSVRCTECRSVLREVSDQRWRYAVDPMENPELYQRFNGRFIDDHTLVELARNPIPSSSRGTSSQVTPPDFVDDDK